MPNTPVFNIELPDIGGDDNTWGNIINNALISIDGIFGPGPALPISKGGTGATDATTARVNLGYGSIATQDASSVSVGTLTTTGNIGVKKTPSVPLDVNGTLKASSLNLTGTMSVSSTSSFSGAVSLDTGNVNSNLKIPKTSIITDLNNKPLVGFGCALKRTTDHVIASGEEYVVSWEQEVYDQANMWSSGTDIYLPKYGLYLIQVNYQFQEAYLAPVTFYLYSGTNKTAGNTAYCYYSSRKNVSYIHGYYSGGPNYIRVSVHNTISNSLTLQAITTYSETKISVICLATF